MSGGRRNDEGGWASTFLKIAGAPTGMRQADPQVVILKVDGSLLREKASAGCGGYLSSASQNWICGFVQKLDPTSKEDETEREAILRGLDWVKKKGMRKVEVKSDNFGVVDLVNSGRRSNDSVICEIRDLLASNDWEAKLSWIPREENSVADGLAHKAHRLTSFDLYEIDSAPENCANDEKDNKEAEEGGWASTFFKIAGAAAATAVAVGALYSVLNQPPAEAAPYGMRPPQAEAAPYGMRQADPQVVILKVDGSLLREKASAGCGGYLSSASQNWICGFVQKLDPTTKEDETEREAILRGLDWVKKKKLRKVEVKSDNFGVVQLVKSGCRSNDPVICGIRELLLPSTDWEAELIQIPREENSVADRLAHIAHGLTSFDLCEIGSPPQNCLDVL